jgi:glycopeptide antibiotics resistance protein
MKAPLRNLDPRRISLGAYVIGLAIVAFWPSPVDKPIYGTLNSLIAHLHGLGVPRWFNYSLIEASANVAMFVPFGFLVYVSLPGTGWRTAIATGLSASTCIEAVQFLFMAERFSSLTDIITNTVGTVIGVVIVKLYKRRTRCPRASTVTSPRAATDESPSTRSPG